MNWIETSFWICMGIVFYAFLGYGFVLYAMVLMKRIYYKNNRQSKPFEPDVTLVIPCFNEVDILKDRLDFDDDVLAELDVVVASLHVPSSSESENTKRIIRAVENPHVHIIGHLTGRLLLEREPYPVNVPAVIDACAANGTWIELNCNPRRFDLDWRHWPYAKSKGVKCVINPDAHHNEHAGFLRLGAGIARKGWLEKEQVVNSLSWQKLSKELQLTSDNLET